MKEAIEKLINETLPPHILSKRAKEHRQYIREFGYSVKECNCAEEGFLAGAQFAITKLIKNANRLTTTG